MERTVFKIDNLQKNDKNSTFVAFIINFQKFYPFMHFSIHCKIHVILLSSIYCFFYGQHQKYVNQFSCIRFSFVNFTFHQ